MYCSKCGKEIDDNAVVCTGCGCPTNNYSSPAGNTVTPKQYSTFSEASNTPAALVRQFTDSVKSIYILSILSLIFCLGIGFIFGILALVKKSNLPKINGDITDPIEAAEYQNALKKLNTSGIMIVIGIAIFVVAVIISVPVIISNM